MDDDKLLNVAVAPYGWSEPICTSERLSNELSVELQSFTPAADTPEAVPESVTVIEESDAPETSDVSLNRPTGLLVVHGFAYGGANDFPSVNVMSFRSSTAPDESAALFIVVVNVPDVNVIAAPLAIVAVTDPPDEPRSKVTK